jgi:ATP/ADP translocase
MQSLFNRTFNLRAGEAGVVAILGFVLFCNALATQISGIAAVSGFLNTVGVNQILIVWFVGYALVIVSASLQSLVVDRFGRVTLMRWTSFGFAMAFLILRLMFTFHVSSAINYSLLYFLSDQQWLFFPLVFWTLGGDLVDTSKSKRLFPAIASIGQIGKIVGIAIALLAPTVLAQIAASPVDVLNVNVLVYMFAYMVSSTALDQSKIRPTRHTPETTRETLTEGFNFVKEVPAFRFLVLAVLTATLCDTIIEFWFLTATDTAFGDGYQTFYSLYRLGVTLAMLTIQSVITARLIERMTLKNSFLILPITLLGGFILMIAGALTASTAAMVVTAVIAMVVMRLARDTVNESARKSFQTLVPEERRGRVTNFVDNYMIAGGTMIGSLLTGIVVVIGLVFNLGDQYGFHYGYQAIGVIAALASLWAIMRMRATYDQSMFNWRLKRRQRGQSVLSKLDF